MLNLSFQLLIADPERAFRDETYGVSYKNNFVTTTEFANILQQLYENDYILISLDDIYHMETDELGQTYLSSKDLYLPQGKSIFEESGNMDLDTDAVLRGGLTSIMPLTICRADLEVFRKLKEK